MTRLSCLGSHLGNCLGVLALTLPGMAAAAPVAKLALKTSYGGAVLVGTLSVPRSDVLLSVMSSQGHSRLMKCAPLCKVVPSVAVKNTLQVSSSSGYRIAMGGSFRPGQKISVTLRLKNQGLVVTQATVQKP